jgi:glyoxylase-like metal-dependent hydrolase (beta-lactamase superfamily II)
MPAYSLKIKMIAEGQHERHAAESCNCHDCQNCQNCQNWKSSPSQCGGGFSNYGNFGTHGNYGNNHNFPATIVAMKVRAALLVCSVLLFSLASVAADSADFAIKKIGDGVYAAIGSDTGKAGSNAGFIVGSNGVAVVDTFVGVAPAKELLDEIRKVTNLPIRYVINTHYHLDHTGGNAVFAQAGATIFAHRNLRNWERTENLKFFGQSPRAEDKTRVEGLVLPDVVYSDGVDLYLGSRLLQVRYMPGHTGGDSVIIVPDAAVVFGGDLVWQRHLPNLIDASTEPWMQTLDKLLADHASATFVSGHGDLATAADVKNFREYLATLRQSVSKAQSDGKSGQALVDAVTADLKPKYGDWGFFNQFVAKNIQQTADELLGKKKIPLAQ